MINLNWRTTTGLYIGAKRVYLAQVKGALFGPRLVKFAQAEIKTEELLDESARVQSVVQAIRRVFRESEITGEKVVAAVCGKDVLVRYFQMPRIPKQEWSTAIKFEAKKHIPFKLEELMWDFHIVLPRAKAANMEVTFVAVKKDVAQRYLTYFEQAHLIPQALEPAPFSLLRLFTLSNQLTRDRPVAIVDVDYGMADINIVKNRICYLTRDVSLPLEEELLFDHLLNEIRISLDYYEKLFPAEVIGKILLSGEVELKDWDHRLAQELKIPVETADLTRALKIGRTLPSLNMAVALGLGLRGISAAVAEVDLFRLRKVKAKATEAKAAFRITPEVRRAVWRAATISLISLLILHLSMFRGVSRERRQLQEIVAQRPKIDLPVSSLSYKDLQRVKEDLEKKFYTLSSLIDKRVFWTKKLEALARIIPPGVWLTDFISSDRLLPDKSLRRTLTLKGVAYHEDPVEEITLVTRFVTELLEHQEFSRGFGEIKLEAMSSAELKGKPVKNFTISCVSR